MAIEKDNEIRASDLPAYLLDKIYPIGSIYMSVNNVSPASFLGGTWVTLQDRFLIGAGNSYAVNGTGGASSHTHTTGGHTLTTSEIPAHTHGSVANHTHSRGTMDITGDFYKKIGKKTPSFREGMNYLFKFLPLIIIYRKRDTLEAKIPKISLNKELRNEVLITYV